MKKRILILLTLIMILSATLTLTSVCCADETTETTETLAETTTSESWFNKLWDKVEPYVMGAVSGVSLGGIVSAVFYGLIKSQTNKTLNKLNDKSTTNEIVSNVVSAIGNTSLSMNIQPIVESKLKVINEAVYSELEKAMDTQREKDLAVINILVALAGYFDNSIGVSDESKEALKKAIENAKSLYSDVETPAVKIETTTEIKAETTESEKVVENY
jgi:hypothetical protein